MNMPASSPTFMQSIFYRQRNSVIFIICGLFCLSMPAMLQAESAWLDSLEKGEKIARKNGKPILLDIYADWCGYCRRMQARVYPNNSVSKQTDKFVKVRLNGEKHPAIMRKYKVRGFPTIVFLNQFGSLLDTVRGYRSVSQFQQKLRDVLVRVDKTRNILDQIKGDPESVHLQYKAGLFYYENNKLREARQYFEKAVRSSDRRAPESKRDALFNLAVVYMDSKDYRGAINYWSSYLGQYPEQGQDTIYAYYYRGIAYYYVSDRNAARRDLTLAAQKLESTQDRQGALDFLSHLK